MTKNISICTHRTPENVYIEPSPMNDGMYIVYDKNKYVEFGKGIGRFNLSYIGYTSVQGLADFINW